jgi:siroheme synthase (precorrin-2 oxidase/ferrochelatase)
LAATTLPRGDLAGARLVVAATDDKRVNELVCIEAKRRRNS